MPVSTQYRELVADLLAGWRPVVVRRMFGGAGVFCDGLMLGLIADDTLYLRADATTQPSFIAAGSQPFSYEVQGRSRSLPYYRCPDAAIEDPQLLAAWAEAAYAAARSAKDSAGKPRRSKRPGK
jgi:DNA transformation protein